MGRRGRVVQGGSCQCRSAPHRPDEPWSWPGHGGPRWAGGPEGQRENTPLPLSLLPSPLACRRARGGPPRPSERRLFWSAAASPWQRVNNVATIRAATCRSAAAALTPPALGSSPPLAPLGHGHRGKSSRRRGRRGQRESTVGKGLPFTLGGTARAGAGRGEGRTNENWPCVGVQKGGFGPAWRRAGTTTPHTTPSPPPPHHANHALPPARPRAARRLGRDHLQHTRSAPATRARYALPQYLRGTFAAEKIGRGGLERSTSTPD